MAILQLENGKIYHNWNGIASQIGGSKVVMDCIPFCQSAEITELMNQDVLSVYERQKILNNHKNLLNTVQIRDRYKKRELIVLHPGSPLLYPFLAQNQSWHTHNESEGLLILSGEVIVGLKDADGNEMQLLLQEGNYIKIPAGVTHWLSLSASLEVKAIRYSLTAQGLKPQYEKVVSYQ
jgi:1,2-dihydroxy-3-keto-5-methylthiopentene dioxygenase